MPKRVDHEERRRKITGALWRIATTEGLRAATLRRVAAEAGVSMNLIQYYFNTKDQLIRDGLQRLIDVAKERLQAELATALKSRDAPAIVRACLIGVLPVDEHSRMLSTVHCAYLAYSLTDPDIAGLTNRVPRELARQLAPVIRRAQLTGSVHSGIDPEREMDALIAMVTGLASGILVDTYTVDEAVEFVDYRLGLLFGS